MLRALVVLVTSSAFLVGAAWLARRVLGRVERLPLDVQKQLAAHVLAPGPAHGVAAGLLVAWLVWTFHTARATFRAAHGRPDAPPPPLRRDARAPSIEQAAGPTRRRRASPRATTPPIASSTPSLVMLGVAIPSERRASLEARLRAAPSVRARLAETIEHEVTAAPGEALVWLVIAAPGALDETVPDADAAERALDALARRDAPSPTHVGGFRDAASRRARVGSGHALLAIALVARDVVLGAREGESGAPSFADRARLADAVAGLLPIAPDAVLHHAYRVLPDDAHRAFDEPTLRATFPELRPL